MNENDEQNKPFKSGLFFDDGTPYNPNLYPLPMLCQSCIYKDDLSEKLLCDLNRLDQHDSDNFKCYAYKCINE
ncbi:MAG: hypothetical protein R3250_15915 [Melioribacteraceae bacterium]|nr:hypothetical protein [Melioribacteraceae bacterium]